MRLFALVILFVFATPAVAQEADEQAAVDLNALLEQLDNQLRVEKKREEIDQVKARRAQLQSDAGDRAAPTGFPVLVRVVGTSGRYVAQFAHGETLFEAREGEPVTPTHKLGRIRLNAVELRGPAGVEVLQLGSAKPTPGRLTIAAAPANLSRAAQGISEPPAIPPPVPAAPEAGQ